MVLKAIILRNVVEILTDSELKNVVGGYGTGSGGSGGYWCYWEASSTNWDCADNEAEADSKSCGGFWCCNCSDSTAKSRCGSA